jgi:hypothetical protein
LKGGILAKTKFYTGTQAKIDAKAIENGAIYAATDKNILAIDVNNKRISVDADTIETNSSDISSLKEELDKKADVDHTHDANTVISAMEAYLLVDADGLLIDIGDENTPIYFEHGQPQACSSMTLGSSNYLNLAVATAYQSNYANMSHQAYALVDSDESALSVGDSNTPVYFKYGQPQACSSTTIDSVNYVNLRVTESYYCNSASTSHQAYELVDSSGLSLDIGDSNTPIYFEHGQPQACSSTTIDSVNYVNLRVTESYYCNSAAMSHQTYELVDSQGSVLEVGNSNIPVYFEHGQPQACSSMTIGADNYLDLKVTNAYQSEWATTCSQATKLVDTSESAIAAGSSTTPVYFSEGVPTAISGPIPASIGGTGLSSSPSMLINLASTSTASVFQASPRPGVTGTLPLTRGGTGATTASAARTKLGLGAAATCATTSSIVEDSSDLITSGAVFSGLQGKASSDIIVVSDTQPTSDTCLLWIEVNTPTTTTTPVGGA